MEKKVGQINSLRSPFIEHRNRVEGIVTIASEYKLRVGIILIRQRKPGIKLVPFLRTKVCSKASGIFFELK